MGSVFLLINSFIHADFLRKFKNFIEVKGDKLKKKKKGIYFYKVFLK